MNRIRALWFWMLLLLAVAVGGLLCTLAYPQLPERVATRFNARGESVGWDSKTGFLRTQLIEYATLLLVFGGMPVLMKYLPKSMVNVPHREFWLSPEMSGYTIALLRDLMLLIGFVTVAYVDGLLYLMLRANLMPPPRLGYVVWIIGGVYTTLVLGALVWMFWFFRKAHRGS